MCTLSMENGSPIKQCSMTEQVPNLIEPSTQYELDLVEHEIR